MQDNNGAFVDTIESINRIAKSKGYVNGAAWAQTAADKGQMTQDEYNRYRDLHTMRIRYAHGNARDIFISDETLEEARMYLARIEGKSYTPRVDRDEEQEPPRAAAPAPKVEAKRKATPRVVVKRKAVLQEEPRPVLREEEPASAPRVGAEPDNPWQRPAPAAEPDNPWRRAAAAPVPPPAAAPKREAAAEPRIDNPWRTNTAAAPRAAEPVSAAQPRREVGARPGNPWRAMMAPQRVELSKFGEKIAAVIGRYRAHSSMPITEERMTALLVDALGHYDKDDLERLGAALDVSAKKSLERLDSYRLRVVEGMLQTLSDEELAYLKTL